MPIPLAVVASMVAAALASPGRFNIIEADKIAEIGLATLLLAMSGA